MYGFRDIIEFKCTEDKNKTYVDRIGDICVYDNGKIGYWCDIYPELPRAGEVPHENVVRVIESAGRKLPKVPPFPYKCGQRILYSWNSVKEGGKEIPSYHKGIVTEVYVILAEDKSEPLFRVTTDLGHCVCTEDKHDIEVLDEPRSQRSSSKRDRKNSK